MHQTECAALFFRVFQLGFNFPFFQPRVFDNGDGESLVHFRRGQRRIVLPDFGLQSLTPFLFGEARSVFASIFSFPALRLWKEKFSGAKTVSTKPVCGNRRIEQMRRPNKIVRQSVNGSRFGMVCAVFVRFLHFQRQSFGGNRTFPPKTGKRFRFLSDKPSAQRFPYVFPLIPHRTFSTLPPPNPPRFQPCKSTSPA